LSQGHPKKGIPRASGQHVCTQGPAHKLNKKGGGRDLHKAGKQNVARGKIWMRGSCREATGDKKRTSKVAGRSATLRSTTEELEERGGEWGSSSIRLPLNSNQGDMYNYRLELQAMRKIMTRADHS